jgi:hypothetical protein
MEQMQDLPEESKLSRKLGHKLVRLIRRNDHRHRRIEARGKGVNGLKSRVEQVAIGYGLFRLLVEINHNDNTPAPCYTRIRATRVALSRVTNISDAPDSRPAVAFHLILSIVGCQ